MKTASANLLAHFAGESLTVATLWKATREDGGIFGFTDGSRDITYLGVVYAASTGHSSSNISTKTGLGVDNLEVQSMLDSETITEDDIYAGLWDFAQIEVFVVNYNALADGHMMLRRGWFGNVSSGNGIFVAELRGMMQPLQQAIGRTVAPSCDAIFGDARCAKNLTAFTFSGSVYSVVNNGQFKTGSAGGDAHYNLTALSLHCNGSNGSTTFTDTSFNPKTVTPYENAQISTAQNKFGGASAYFDGVGDFISANHADLSFGTGQLTMEAFFYFPTSAINGGLGTLASEAESPTSRGVNIWFIDGVLLARFGRSVIGYLTDIYSNTNVVQGVWHHIAVTRNANNIVTLWLNGDDVGQSSCNYDLTMTNFAAGKSHALYSGEYLTGYIDDIRITKGFCRYTENFTVPTSAFIDSASVGGLGKLDQYFNNGVIIWTSGANNTRRMDVKSYSASTETILLQQKMANDIQSGDTFSIIAGCNKSLSICRSKFNNVVNFRGFPHLPGNDKFISGS